MIFGCEGRFALQTLLEIELAQIYAEGCIRRLIVDTIVVGWLVLVFGTCFIRSRYRFII